MDFKFEKLAMYRIDFETFTNVHGFINNGSAKPFVIKAIFFYVGETDTHINFATGISSTNQDFNSVLIPKNSIISKPIRLLKQPNLDFIDSKTEDEIVNE